ncbi:6-pyruvoyl trahydropterin synthase family protein [Halomarina oriensis]|uniref:6-carboxytetrahydropterin synthase n=1 Tax=Halomarina oriensis TaxID=671145 RepID=A0A6B0GK21_9EURY|nr:6-carboxytetrahydropterin synthase [Halomarina oriensis]MWG34221.1 6-carboxytetrahydropterin synthase [Halomarina oriensis]
MYTVTVTEAFVAQHVLTVPDPGPEGDLHAHQFTAHAEFRGPTLGEHDYLLDIDDARAALAAVADDYRDTTLNDRAGFLDRNPSVELLARRVHEALVEALDAPGVEELVVTVEEDDVASVAYHAPFGDGRPEDDATERRTD